MSQEVTNHLFQGCCQSCHHQFITSCISTSINIYHRGHWVHLTKASYLHHNNHPQPRQMKMFNYLSLQSPARSLASTWLLWTSSEVESMESPPTTGQKNILFIKVARGYQNWHRNCQWKLFFIIIFKALLSTWSALEKASDNSISMIDRSMIIKCWCQRWREWCGLHTMNTWDDLLAVSSSQFICPACLLGWL